MKAQLKVGRGSGDLWAIPSVSRGFERDTYLPDDVWPWFWLAVLAGALLAALLLPRRTSR